MIMYFTSTNSQCNNKCQVLSLRVILMYIISNISRAIYAERHGTFYDMVRHGTKEDMVFKTWYDSTFYDW